MTRDDLVRKLRDLRKLERRLTGSACAPLWDEYFALEEGRRVRFPFAVLLVFDRPSREHAFGEYLFALWARGAGADPDEIIASSRLREALGLRADAPRAEVRAAFRRRALELHPDQGGDEASMRELIELYRAGE
ncbi:MAG: hypothetical protein ACOC1U_03240 [Spirochaetota bacterium]